MLVDVETSSLFWEEGARVIEVAAMLYDTRHASAIESFACLVKHDSNAAEEINGIPAGLLVEQGLDAEDVWDRFVRLSEDAECFVAHRAEFDRSFVSASIGALQQVPDGASHLDGWDPAKPWVCTKTDIAWPGGLRGDHLAHLALGLGLGVASAHRAMADVDTMARCLTRAAERGMLLEMAIRKGMRPKVRVVARVSYDQRDVAKRAGFLWDDKRREWYRLMPAEDVAALDFHAVVQS